MRKSTKYKIGISVGVLILLYYKFFTIKEPDWNFLNEENVVLGREINSIQRHDKWIVVTTIQQPTEAVKKLSKIPGWRVVVVGDRKTPSNWKLINVVYLDPATQKSLRYRIHDYLPYDSYSRKVMGYLYAIEHGAQFIYETDDDNFISSLDGFHTTKADKGLIVNTFDITYNPYPHFGQTSVWPRGYPLEYVGREQPRDYLLCSVQTPAIQQGLVNGEPDVDAIFRMTRRHDSIDLPTGNEFNFDSNAPVMIVPHGTFAPHNSQNTLYIYKAFWSLVLPTMVTDRATDIYRSYWAQKLLWLAGGNLAFYPPAGHQDRNKWHKNINDAKEEQDLYSNMGRYINFLSKWKCSKLFFFDCITELTQDLVVMGFWSKRDLELVRAWVTDLAAVNYAPPALSHPFKQFCKPGDEISVIHYPWEQNITLPYTSIQSVLPHSSNLQYMQDHVSNICGLTHRVHLEHAIANAAKFTDVLLVVTVTNFNAEIIATLDTVYRIHFPHILYCGQDKVNINKVSMLKISYVGLSNASPVQCVNEASKMNYKVSGYFHVTQNTFVRFENLHVSDRNKNQMWVTGLDLYIFKESIIELCNKNEIQCTKTNKETYFLLAEKLRYIQGTSHRTKEYIKCLKKVGSDPTIKTAKVTTSKELSFYIPHRLSETLNELLQVYLRDDSFTDTNFIAVLMMECTELTTEYLHSTDLQDMDSTEHYDYIFPFLFKNIHPNSDSVLKQKYCEYIQSH